MIVLWLLGMVTFTAIGGLIHILLVAAIVMVLIQPGTPSLLVHNRIDAGARTLL